MENQETILKIYQNFSNDIHKMTTEKMNISKRISEQEDKLTATLTDEQKEMLKKLHKLEDEKNQLVYQNTFRYGYQLATKSVLEGLGIKIDNVDKNK